MKNLKKIIFFNHYHNGDLHFSRMFVSKIMHYYGNKFNYYYLHNNSCYVLKDLDVEHLQLKKFSVYVNKNIPWIYRNDELYINTWYGINDRKYIFKYGMTFNCLYHIFNDCCKKNFNITLNDIDIDKSSFFPEINFNKYFINNIDNWMKDKNDFKKILISNNLVYSGQSENFDMNKIVKMIASSNKNIIFIATNKDTNLKISNVFYAEDIIKTKELNLSSDLNEISYISTFCNFIIGRGSGPYSFSIIKRNFFDKNKKFLIICHSRFNELLRWTKVDDFDFKYKCKLISCNKFDANSIVSIINKNI